MKQEAAYHEAGHAVGAVVLGLSLEFVTIIPEEGWFGRTRFNEAEFDMLLNEYEYDGDWNELAYKHLISSLTGEAAVVEFGFKDEPDWEGTAASDAEGAFTLMTKMGFSDLDPFIGDAEALAYEHREAIYRVARALLEKGELTGAEVEALVNAT